MKSLLYHGFGIKGYRYLRTWYEKGEIVFELERCNSLALCERWALNA